MAAEPTFSDTSPPPTRAGGGGGAGERQWYEEVAVSTLLRGALRAYGSAVQTALAAVGCDDVPRNGAFVLTAIARSGSPLGGIIRALGVSKQAAGQLVDTLVLRGYLVRTPDPDDRRRMTVRLTDRGRVAADAAHRAVEEIDGAVTERVGARAVAATRATLAALLSLEHVRDHGPRDD
jgi:DNA-binding MarR family transcriptional regulator